MCVCVCVCEYIHAYTCMRCLHAHVRERSLSDCVFSCMCEKSGDRIVFVCDTNVYGESLLLEL